MSGFLRVCSAFSAHEHWYERTIRTKVSMKRHLITSALPYINGVKHLGNLVGSMLPADVYARFLRMQPDTEVLLICATDEHGTPAELAALDAGLPVAEYCREQHEIQARLGEAFGLSFDYFGRSSSQQNRELTQHFARVLQENGLIEARGYQQIYSKADGRFLPDRYVVGTCPHCGYEAARGDQCESCTKVLDTTDLIEPRSAISGSTDLEVRDSTHLFLLQEKLAGEIRAWIDTKNDWPKLVTSIALKWLDEGLRDRCITRDLEWGVPVDREGFEGKVFYVWFDAPIEYIGATKEWADEDPENRDWKSWWYNAPELTYTEFMAKDNVPFHTVGFPVTILGSQEPWKLVDYIKGFNWLTYYGGKFSTSQKRGVFMSDAAEMLPVDYWRYYLMANAPETNDSSFTWEHFAATVNKDLADTFGNFVNRALRLTEKYFGKEVPAGGAPGDSEAELATQLSKLLDEYRDHHATMQYRKALQSLKAIWTLGNTYFDRQEPWKSIKTDKDGTACTLRTAINLVRIFSVAAYPIIPFTSERVLTALGIGEAAPTWFSDSIQKELQVLEAGHPFEIPPPLFEKIDDDQVATWAERFGGATATTS